MNDDLDAIRRVLADDVESFRLLVERYQRPLLTLVRNLTPPETDHEPDRPRGSRPGGFPGGVPLPGIVRPNAVGVLDLAVHDRPQPLP
jgi:hypothetical protein